MLMRQNRSQGRLEFNSNFSRNSHNLNKTIKVVMVLKPGTTYMVAKQWELSNFKDETIN